MTAATMRRTPDASRERIKLLCDKKGQQVPAGLGRMSESKLDETIARLERLPNVRSYSDPESALACYGSND